MRLGRKKLEHCLNEYAPSLVLGKRIGWGGTADVYDLPGTKPAEVLKVLDTRCMSQSDSDTLLCLSERRKMWEYFQSEINVMNELVSCKYVVPILGSYEYIDQRDRALKKSQRSYRSVFLVRMKKLESLDSYIEKHGLSEKMLVQLAVDICRALISCEEHSILHRDVKPSNIFVDEEGDHIRFVLGDFGFCRRLSAFDTTISICGTKAFMAPEIEHHIPIENNFNSDLFSLGSSLYFLLSGGKFPKYYFEKGEDQIEQVKGVSLAFQKIILRAVQLYPSKRYQHAYEMLDAILGLSFDNQKRVVNQSYFIQAKNEMLKANFKRAIQLAQKGCEKRAEGCSRLLAYCLYHEYKDCAEIVEKVKRMLEVLAYEGDATAQYLRAVIHYEENEPGAFVDGLKQSASDGCVIAKYTYGRFLYTGQPSLGIQQDRTRGIENVVFAVQQGYYPALRFLKMINDNDRSILLPSSVATYLTNELSNYQERLRDEIVKFL